MPHESYLIMMRDYDTQINILNKKKNNTLQSWIDKYCSFKLGDAVLIENGSYSGKFVLIEKLIVRERFNRYEWVAGGRIMKMNCKPGRIQTSVVLRKFDKEKVQ